MGNGTVYPRSVFDNLKDVRERIGRAARRAGRDPEAVEIAAVVKKSALADVRSLIGDARVAWFAENRVQDGLRRRSSLGDAAAAAGWRFIGHLQKNKVNQVLGSYDWIDSLDSLKLAGTLNAKLHAAGKTVRVLVQVKLTDREAQNGVALEKLSGFLERLQDFPCLKPGGLMAIAPFTEPVEAVRPSFRRVREAFERHFPLEAGLRGEGPYLSLGMSRDFEIAVEEGANLVRIGSALFGGDYRSQNLSQIPTLQQGRNHDR